MQKFLFINYHCCRPVRARSIVTGSAYSRSLPVGKPRARRVIATPLPASFEAKNAEVASPSSVGFSAKITSEISPSATRFWSSAIFKSSAETPEMGDSTPWSTWYRPKKAFVASSARRSRTSSTTQTIFSFRCGFWQIGQVSNSVRFWQMAQSRSPFFRFEIVSPNSAQRFCGCFNR